MSKRTVHFVLKTFPFVNAAMETECFENLYVCNREIIQTVPKEVCFYNRPEEDPKAMSTHTISLCLILCDFKHISELYGTCFRKDKKWYSFL